MAKSLTYTVSFMAYDKPNGTVEALARAFLEKLEAMGDRVQVQSSIVAYPSYHEAFKPDVTLEPVGLGTGSLGSRLLPADALEDAEVLGDVFRSIGPTLDPSVVSCVLLPHSR